MRTHLIVAALLLGMGCAGQRSIYGTPEVEAAIENTYSERLAGWPLPYETRYVPTSYGVAHVVVSGPAEGKPVLLLHAMGVTATLWRDNVATLGREHRVYALDFIGDLGRSRLSRPRKHPGDGAEAAAWVAEVMDGLGLRQADVVGASYGGWAALNLARHRPERVRRVALLGPMGVAPVTADVLRRLMTVVMFPTEENRRWLVDSTLGDDARVREQFVDYMMVATQCRGELATPWELTDEDLRQVRAPVLLLLGDDDSLIPASAAADRARALLGAVEVEVLPDTGHLMNVEEAEQVNERLVAFLGR